MLLRFSNNLILAVAAICAVQIAAQGVAEEKSGKPKATYQDDLVPVLRESCFGCHNPDKTKGGLNLTTFATLMQGGSSGAAIEPGDPGSSYLWQLVSHESEPHMPLNSPKLPDEKLAIIRRFIEDGALESSGSKPQAKKEHAELKLSSAANQKPDGPPPMPPHLSLEPVIHTLRAGAITALAASPWAPLVAVAGQDQVLLYNTDTLQLFGVLPFPEGTVHVLRFSRNGKLLLAGGGHEAKSGRVVLWDIATGKRITEIGDEYDVVLAADISPDQSLVALGGPSKVVRIFSSSTGELLNQIKKHTDWITALQFSPDNKLLATGDRNGEVLVWEAAKAREQFSLHGHTAAITSLSWRGDGNALASGSDDGSIRLWEMENGKQTKTWNSHGGVQWVEFCSDGKVITCGRDHLVRLWSGDGKQQGKEMPLPDVAMRVAATTDSSKIIGGDWTGEIRIWNAADGKQLAALADNPPMLADRLATANKELSARKADYDKLLAVAETSGQQAANVATDLSKAQHDLDAATSAEKTAKTELADLQKAIEQNTAEISKLKSDLENQESAAAALVESVAKAQQAADKLPENSDLADSLARLKASAEKQSTEVSAMRKSLDGKTHELTVNQEKAAAEQKQIEKLVTESGAARKQVETLSASAKVTGDKAAADKQAADHASAAVNGAQAEVQRWTQEIEFATSAAK